MNPSFMKMVAAFIIGSFCFKVMAQNCDIASAVKPEIVQKTLSSPAQVEVRDTLQISYGEAIALIDIMKQLNANEGQILNANILASYAIGNPNGSSLTSTIPYRVKAFVGSTPRDFLVFQEQAGKCRFAVFPID